MKSEYYAIGGLVGQLNSGNVSNCYVKGIINATNSYYAGGIIGHNMFGVIQNSYSDATIIGDDLVGGIVGYNQIATVQNCYSKGQIQTNFILGLVGGIVGHFDGGEVSNNFSVAPSITLNNSGSGIVGDYQWGTRTNNYWDTFLTSTTTCFGDGNTSCTPTENNPTAYYGLNGIPFDSDKLNWSTEHWTAQENDYPILSWQIE